MEGYDMLRVDTMKVEHATGMTTPSVMSFWQTLSTGTLKGIYNRMVAARGLDSLLKDEEFLFLIDLLRSRGVSIGARQFEV